MEKLYNILTETETYKEWCKKVQKKQNDQYKEIIRKFKKGIK